MEKQLLLKSKIDLEPSELNLIKYSKFKYATFQKLIYSVLIVSLWNLLTFTSCCPLATSIIFMETRARKWKSIITKFSESKWCFSLHFTGSRLLLLAWVYVNSVSLKQWIPWAVSSGFLILFPLRLENWELTVLETWQSFLLYGHYTETI